MLLLSVRSAHSQTAADIEKLLDAEEITCSQAAYFVLAAALENPPQNPEAAFTLARENGWLPAKAEGGNITLGGLSLLMMKAFNQRLAQAGGLMYRLFPGSRYAYRAMASHGFIEGRTYPGQNVSGGQFLRILEKVIAGEGTKQ
jgi:hypothetical protein